MAGERREGMTTRWALSGVECEICEESWLMIPANGELLGSVPVDKGRNEI